MAGERETLEEAGVAAKMVGVLSLNLEGCMIPRVLLLAEPLEEHPDDTPKSVPNFESCGALSPSTSPEPKPDHNPDLRGPNVPMAARVPKVLSLIMASAPSWSR